MDSKDIKSIVNIKKILEFSGKIARDGTDNTEDDSGPRRDKSRSWGDGDETSNDARAEPHCRPLAIKTVIEEDPGDTSCGGSGVGDEAGHDGADVSSKGRTTVEAEPADPQEHRAEDDVGDVVWAVWETSCCAVTGALAKHQRVGECSSAGRDMDWSSTSEVKATEHERPAIGVPGPAGDRIVDNGGPDEDEDNTWEHATTVSSRADGKCGTV